MQSEIADGVIAHKKGKKVNMSYQAKERRRRVITRLEAQLKNGKKPDRDSQAAITRHTVGETFIPLEEKDINRIKKELETLKGRI